VILRSLDDRVPSSIVSSESSQTTLSYLGVNPETRVFNSVLLFHVLDASTNERGAEANQATTKIQNGCLSRSAGTRSRSPLESGRSNKLNRLVRAQLQLECDEE
jgi:hypothetical protein